MDISATHYSAAQEGCVAFEYEISCLFFYLELHILVSHCIYLPQNIRTVLYHNPEVQSAEDIPAVMRLIHHYQLNL
jgi:hypothetical protein